MAEQLVELGVGEGVKVGGFVVRLAGASGGRAVVEVGPASPGGGELDLWRVEGAEGDPVNRAWPVGPCRSQREALALAQARGPGHYMLFTSDGATVSEFDVPPARGALLAS